jgi:aromatic-L-amino-acid decarboxylase
LRDRPVRAPLVPGAVAAQLPGAAPEAPEPMEAIWADFERIVPGGMTHWQHPRFFAYFPANAAPASMLAEQLVQCHRLRRACSGRPPAATEVEQVMIQWLRAGAGPARGLSGTIHDSATTATLSAVLTMRERALAGRGLTKGLAGQPRLAALCQRRDAFLGRQGGAGGRDRAAQPGQGADRCHLSMRPGALAGAIAADRAAGMLPAGVVLCAGGTSVGAFDRIADCIAVARAEGLPVHVDAAWAGSAMICPEFRALWAGVEGADSIVFNPHKWLGAQFDCAVQFLRDPGPQVRTLGLRPTYLETAGREEIVNFNEWTVPLGRRFRALKLWFVLRAYGLTACGRASATMWPGRPSACEALRAMPGVRDRDRTALSLFTFCHGR